MGKMQTNEKEPEQKKWAAAVNVLFPNSDGRGTHVNISGMSMTRHAPNGENALKLIEYLTSAEAQQIYGKINYEYPVKPGVEASERVKSWGSFKPDTINLETIAKNRKAASELVDKVRFNDGPDS